MGHARAADGIATARELVDKLKADPPGDALATLRQYDEVSLHLSNVAAMGSLFSNVHPEESVRDAAEKAEQDVHRLVTELNLDRDLYEVFAALDGAGLDDQAARLLAKILQDFSRSGVDQDEETRARITKIQERMTELDQEFCKNIRDDTRTIRVTPERLAGLPADWLEAHPADDDGLVTVTTDYPDSVPTRMYAHDADVRRDMAVAFLTVGWPQNDALLKELFALRHEMANLVGYDDWASFDADVKMIKKGPAIPEFIDKIAAASEEPMRRDLEVLLERFRQDVPDATGDRLRRQPVLHGAGPQGPVRGRLAAGPHLLRLRQGAHGLLDVTGRLFGVRYEPVTDVALWDDEVAAYDVFDVDAADGAEPRGRIFLDLHPRKGKYNHAAQFTLTEGIAGRQLPEGVLVCNFSRQLMEHDHVVTLFHEFGHLVHHILGGRAQWTRFAGVATEWDFVEAPSQMLEEWAWDADVLQSFATNEAGEPIPADLVERMRQGDDFGKGIYARTQMFYASMSYWFHTERPDDLVARMKELQAKYAAFPYIEGTQMFASFGHLGGYSSAYYTYMWSLVIAKDLFSAFDPADLFDAEVAGRYRDRVLAPGGTKDAADLVADFLGRPYTFDAYAEWLAS